MLVLTKDYKEFIELLNGNHVEYIPVGGYALMLWGRNRFTGDIDFWVKPTQENAIKVANVFKQFGFDGMDAKEFEDLNTVVQLGYPSVRIDVLTSLSGVDFDTAYQASLIYEQEGLAIRYIRLNQLIDNKRALGRRKDLGDLKVLSTIKRKQDRDQR